MSDSFELKFDSNTIEHLGVKMYSTLPPALAELISNAYDADASEVVISFHEQNGSPISITVMDDGQGMSSEDIQNKFLVIGRNRRKFEGDEPSPLYGRLATGKKGLGKLALFGLSALITVDTVKNGLRNRFNLDWDKLLTSDGVYDTQPDLRDEQTGRRKGTTIKLSNLKRKTAFNLKSLADSLSRIFIVDSSFSIILKDTRGNEVHVSNDRRFSSINKEFEWDVSSLMSDKGDPYSQMIGNLITSEKPIPPGSGVRGITLFSRGKLVNAPEFFSSSTSSYFYEYLTGWISADFIDLIVDDVISTNRQSINWDHPDMEKLRDVLSGMVSAIGTEWRAKRKKAKERNFKIKTGIDTAEWFSTLPSDVKESAQAIVKTLSDDEGVSASFTPVIEALHKIIPEYPDLHWRHLHEDIKESVKKYYQAGMYGEAADQAAKIYSSITRDITNSEKDGSHIADHFTVISPAIAVADVSTKVGKNIQEGQMHMTRGVMHGFRNNTSHDPMGKLVPTVFSELDCLNILSLISYLVAKLDNAEVNMDNVKG